MVEVVASESQTSLAQLLVLVESGDEVLITRGGEPVARLLSNFHPLQKTNAAVAAMKRMRQRTNQLTSEPFDWEAYKQERDAGRS